MQYSYSFTECQSILSPSKNWCYSLLCYHFGIIMWKFTLVIITTLSLHQLSSAGTLAVNRINLSSTSSEDNGLKQDKKEYNVAPIDDKTNNNLSVPDEKYTKTKDEVAQDNVYDGPVPCTCGVFLSGQFKKGSKEQPKGVPVLTQEMDTPFMNNSVGNRQCTNKCLELIIKHLPKSSDIICATVDRDEVYREKAFLFVKNHSDKWLGTNLSAGREFCCKENLPYKCNAS